MMENSFSDIEEKLVGYLSGQLADEDKQIVDDWRKESPENEKIFQEMKYSWEALPTLKTMEQFNSFEALKKVHTSIEQDNPRNWMFYFQRIAAVLIIPILIYSLYVALQNSDLKELSEKQAVIQKVTSHPGIISHFLLDDGTEVWLNSGSTLEFPLKFTGEKRNVKLTGEAFFNVARNEDQPFVLNSNELNIEVLGTSFNVVSYANESTSEVVLVTGKVKLYSESENTVTQLGSISPGKRALYSKSSKKVITQDVNVDKYISWRDGNLIFRDDSMGDVINRLSHWFNVEITVMDPEINNYVYTATFSNETLAQVLYLLKISAPIDYKLEESKMLKNGEYTKQKVILMKRKKYRS